MTTTRSLGRPNLMLVVADTTRADSFARGLQDGSAPMLASAVRHGCSYIRAVAPSSWTAPSHASMFTGLCPSEHGIWMPTLFDAAGRPRGQVVQGEVATRWLPRQLSSQGYRTLGVSANPWVAPYFGFDTGFDRFLSLKTEPSEWSRRSTAARLARPLPEPLARRLRHRRLTSKLRKLGPDSGAKRLISTMCEWIDETDGAFFAFANLMEAHWPYRPPAAHEAFSRADLRLAAHLTARFRRFGHVQVQTKLERPALAPEESAMLRRLYDGEVDYLQQCLSELLDRLVAAGRLDDTVVVIVSDHGEHLGEDGLLGHANSVREELAHVPLLALGPADLVGRGVEEKRVSTQSLYAAFKAWSHGERAGLQNGSAMVEDEGIWFHPAIRGLDLRASRAAELSATSRAVYLGDWKYVRDEAGHEALYDLASEAGESVSVGAAGPLHDLRAHLTDLVASRRPPVSQIQHTPAGGDAEVERALNALGYM